MKLVILKKNLRKIIVNAKTTPTKIKRHMLAFVQSKKPYFRNARD